MSSLSLARTDRESWQCLAATLRELTGSASVEQIAAAAAKAVKQLCNADAIALHNINGIRPEYAPASAVGHARSVCTSVTIASGGSHQHSTMTVDWYDPHIITDADRDFLDLLTQSVSLALSALPATPIQYPTAVCVSRPRERFFDFTHQVLGPFAVVRSIVRRMTDTSQSIEQYAAHLEGRLGALSRVQSFLLRAPDASVDLEELVRSEFLAQSIPDERLRIGGPRVLLTSKAAGTLGLVLHELATNSIKFGALTGVDGDVHVLWRRQGAADDDVRLDWRETGQNLPPQALTKGFGFELIERALPRELGGTSCICVHPSGLECSITFGVPRRERPACR